MRNVVIIGDIGDTKLPQAHPEEYKKVEIITSEEASRVPGRFIGGGVPQRGDVFVKHPYMDCFVANNADLDYNICAAMVGELTSFAQLLGARHIYFSITITSRKLFSNQTEINVKAGTSTAKARSKYKKEEEMFANLSRGLNFIRDNDSLSDDEFEEANHFFEKSILFKYCDPTRTAKSMLLGRDPKAGTKSKDLHQVVAQTINLNEDLSIALSLKKASALKANGAYSQNRKFSKHFRIEMFYDFEKNHDMPESNATTTESQL